MRSRSSSAQFTRLRNLEEHTFLFHTHEGGLVSAFFTHIFMWTTVNIVAGCMQQFVAQLHKCIKWTFIKLRVGWLLSALNTSFLFILFICVWLCNNCNLLYLFICNVCAINSNKLNLCFLSKDTQSSVMNCGALDKNNNTNNHIELSAWELKRR